MTDGIILWNPGCRKKEFGIVSKIRNSYVMVFFYWSTDAHRYVTHEFLGINSNICYPPSNYDCKVGEDVVLQLN
jgi:hypothetical protein